MNIGVFGATGPAGRAVAVQYAALGTEVIVGSRAKERAADTVNELIQRWPDRHLPLVPGENAEAASADVVVIATPWEGALATVTEHADALTGKIVISMVNALTRWGRHLVPMIPPTGSVAAAIGLALPQSRVAASFHHLPAGPWADLDHPIESDVLVCADSRATAREVIVLVDRLPGLRGIDAGGLTCAAAVEAFTATLVEVNRRYKVHTSLRLAGLDLAPQ